MSLLFKYTARTVTYTLSLHDALPICHFGAAGDIQDAQHPPVLGVVDRCGRTVPRAHRLPVVLSTVEDRKSTRLNSSHVAISYAVFCLKKNRLKVTIVTVYILINITYS